MTCLAILCGVVGGVVGVHCRSRVGGVGGGWRMLGSGGGGGGECWKRLVEGWVVDGTIWCGW
jgi:hypothetical protein